MAMVARVTTTIAVRTILSNDVSAIVSTKGTEPSHKKALTEVTPMSVTTSGVHVIY